MQIEKEIPENYFRNERHKALINIIFTSNWLLEKLKRFLEGEDITHQQYNILRILEKSELPLSTLQIRERMLDKMSDTSRIVERLLKKDLVRKQICVHDKRLVDVTITEKGKILLDRINKDAYKIDKVVSKLTDDEISRVNELLDRIREKD
jgi:DNA-binding MarR family transcriptional regulator